MLRSVLVEEGLAHVDFADALQTKTPGASTSAGSLVLLAELDATTEQFLDISDSTYSLAGDVEAFYEWLQRDPPRWTIAPRPSLVGHPEADPDPPLVACL